MNFPDLGLIVIAVLLACPAGQAKDTDEAIFAPESASSDADLDAVANKLLLDKMYAGKLADAIIESGAYEKIIKSPAKDRADARGQVISWIQLHPRQAAMLGSAASSTTGGKTFDRKRIQHYLNEQFERLANEFSDKVKSSQLSPEGMAAASDSFFEGARDNSSQSAVYAGGGTAFKSSRKPIDIPPLDWQLSETGINAEKKSVTKALDALEQEIRLDKAIAAKRLTGSSAPARKIESDGDLRSALLNTLVNGKPVKTHIVELFSTRDNALAQSIQTKQTFLLYLTRFSSRKKLSAEESGQLETLRTNLRLSLARLQAAASADHLARDSREMELISPASLAATGATPEHAAQYCSSAEKLLRQSSSLQAKYTRLMNLAKTGGITLPELYSRLEQLGKEEDAWRLKWLIYVSVPAMTRQAVSLRPQTKTDYLMGKIFLPLYPHSSQAQVLRAFALYKKTVRLAFKAVTQGNFDYASALFASATRNKNPEDGVRTVSGQIDFCVYKINLARMKSELTQLAFFEGPFYRPAAPLIRKTMPRILNIANGTASKQRR
ncbi:MAG: hypothetical protein WCS77_07635 [Elusimicrobiaceae bacterium]